jgi:hypothetical protein
MDGGARPPNRIFRISPVDRLGRRISPSVLDAAEDVGRRAIEHAEREHIDPAVAATLLEEAAATVSRALDAKRHRTQNAVRDLPSYLFLAFIRRVNRTKKRQLLLEDAVQVEDGSLKFKQRAKMLGRLERYPRESDIMPLKVEFMHRLNAGKFTPESSMNLKEFVEHIYLPYTDELRGSTKKGYREIWNNHISDRVGQIRLREFRTVDASRMLKAIRP